MFMLSSLEAHISMRDVVYYRMNNTYRLNLNGNMFMLNPYVGKSKVTLTSIPKYKRLIIAIGRIIFRKEAEVGSEKRVHPHKH